MVALIAAGVVMRYLFALPILGVNEIVQLTAVAVAMLALPWCTAEGAHVRVDVLDPFIGRWGRFLGDVLSRALSAFVLAVLVWRSALKSLDALKYGDATNMLSLPIWPFYAMIAAGMALCVLVLLGQLALILKEGPNHV
ncbi:TRAP transporter small permease [Neotabrizicola shimadae]|uniref:TRAP transporter small permease protein n=2 Tax=Neotabrizicola shimadae TaxID=2807096 RepID=A0A8G1EEZ9_9RHOB|nr:TRAP transporter small permease [Neotabrizicola shimadae]